MSYQVEDKKEMYDWHHHDIVYKSPYSHYDTVVLLAEGRFIIEGKTSNVSDAEFYADYHSGEPSVWRALQDWEDDKVVKDIY